MLHCILVSLCMFGVVDVLCWCVRTRRVRVRSEVLEQLFDL